MASKYQILAFVLFISQQPTVYAAAGNTSFEYLEDWCNHHTKVSSDGTCTEPGTFTIPGNCTSYYECTEDENGTTVIAHIKTCQPGFTYDILGCVQEASQTKCPQMNCSKPSDEMSLTNETDVVNKSREGMNEMHNPMLNTTEAFNITVANKSMVGLTGKLIHSSLQQKNETNDTMEVHQQVKNETNEENMNETLTEIPRVEAHTSEENTTTAGIETQLINVKMSLTTVSNGKYNSTTILVNSSGRMEVQKEDLNETLDKVDILSDRMKPLLNYSQELKASNASVHEVAPNSTDTELLLKDSPQLMVNNASIQGATPSSSNAAFEINGTESEPSGVISGRILSFLAAAPNSSDADAEVAMNETQPETSGVVLSSIQAAAPNSKDTGVNVNGTESGPFIFISSTVSSVQMATPNSTDVEPRLMDSQELELNNASIHDDVPNSSDAEVEINATEPDPSGVISGTMSSVQVAALNSTVAKNGTEPEPSGVDPSPAPEPPEDPPVQHVVEPKSNSHSSSESASASTSGSNLVKLNRDVVVAVPISLVLVFFYI